MIKFLDPKNRFWAAEEARILLQYGDAEVTRTNILLFKISTPFLTFLIPFVIIKAELISSEFSNPA